MPQQLYCDVCTERIFYVMLQEDGSVESFCVRNNHRRVLVNIPELVAHIYKQESETNNAPKEVRPTDNGDAVNALLEAKAAANDTSNIDGSSAGFDMQDPL